MGTDPIPQSVRRDGVPCRHRCCDGRGLMLRDRRGRPVPFAMFCSSCACLCPSIVETTKRSEHALDAESRTAARSDKLGEIDRDFLAAVQKATRAAP